MGQASDGANVHFPPPLIYLAGLVLGIVFGRMLALPGLGLEPQIRNMLGGALIFAGLVVSFAGVGLFLRRGTAIIPFKPATGLVASGIYRWSRNPMYLGMALTYSGVTVLFNSLAALILLPVVLAIIQMRVIAKEEAYLERAFGNDYLAYKSSVRRWI